MKRTALLLIAASLLLQASACSTAAPPTPIPPTAVPTVVVAAPAPAAPAAPAPTAAAPAPTVSLAAPTVGPTTAPAAATAVPQAAKTPDTLKPPAAATSPAAASSAKLDYDKDAAALASLSSYRLRIVLKIKNLDNPSESVEMSVLQESVKSPSAKRVLVSIPGLLGEVEMIQIGDKSWVKMGGSWIESETTEDEDLAGSMQSVLDDVDTGITLVGEETVNGVRCKRYAVDAKSLSKASSAGDSVTSVKGDAWIASQTGIPKILVRERITVEGSALGGLGLPGAAPAKPGSDAKQRMSALMERDITDINTAISIKAPEDVQKMPTAPGIAPAKPTAPAR